MGKRGFTLAEIIIVIVILGVVATLTIPNLSKQQESSRVSEAVQALTGYFAAQQRLLVDRAVYSSSATCSDLDITLVPKNFTITCANDGTATVYATRSTAVVPCPHTLYRIYVNDQGVFSCTDNTAGPNACSTVTALKYINRFLPK